ncbi:hypothetical protein JCM5296_001022 [Sporobolomyces johnsonii]
MPTSDSSNPCNNTHPPPAQPADALSQLASLSATLSSLAHSFQVPDSLTFQPTATSSNPKLTYTSNNAPLHAYEERLTRLLTELDGVDSGGDPEIRAQRKRLVHEVERELEKLDAIRRREWERQQQQQQQRERTTAGERGRANEPVGAAGQRPVSVHLASLISSSIYPPGVDVAPAPPQSSSSRASSHPRRASSHPRRADPTQEYYGSEEEKDWTGGARRERAFEPFDAFGAKGGRLGGGTSRLGSRSASRPGREREKDPRRQENPFWVGLPSRFG